MVLRMQKAFGNQPRNIWYICSCHCHLFRPIPSESGFAANLLSKSDYNFFVRGKTIQNSSTQNLVFPQTNCNVQGPGVPASYWRIPICKILACMKLQLPSSFLGAARFLIAALYKKIELSGSVL